MIKIHSKIDQKSRKKIIQKLLKIDKNGYEINKNGWTLLKIHQKSRKKVEKTCENRSKIWDIFVKNQ